MINFEYLSIAYFLVSMTLSVSYFSSRPLHVCCIGAGPGSEVLGLHEVLPKDTHWHLMDSCEQWSHTARLLLQNIPGIKFNYGAFDITARFHPAHIFKKVSGCPW